MIKDTTGRRLVFDLDTALQGLVAQLGRNNAEVRTLTNVYHNLTRYWADV